MVTILSHLDWWILTSFYNRYGDVYPFTTAGRLLVVLAGFGGLLITASTFYAGKRTREYDGGYLGALTNYPDRPFCILRISRSMDFPPQ